MTGLRLYLLIGAVVGVVVGTYFVGQSAGYKACQAENAKLVEIERKRQVEAGNVAVDAARKRADAAEVENVQLQDQVETYVKTLTDRPDAAACVLSPADADSLR